jgi:Toxin PAAR-like domain
MPGPPAPFVPTPLPNIGKSGDSPDGNSQDVTIEGNPVAIQGASFGSQGDMASKGTGGGIVSNNTHGPTKFLGPGSLDVKIEGKNVQLLSDPTLNNGGPSGSPPNAATMAGDALSPNAAPGVDFAPWAGSSVQGMRLADRRRWR